MRKNWLVTICLILVLALNPAISLAQEQADRFAFQTITLPNQGGYDLTVSPDATVAAVYAGQTARILLGIPIVEYDVEPSLLPIRLIDLNTGDVLSTLTGHTDYVTDVAFTPDGSRLLSYHRNGDMILWDVTSGEPVQQFFGIVGMGQVEFLPDGKSLIVYLSDSTVGHFLVWDLDIGAITQIWRDTYRSFGELALNNALGRLDYTYAAFDVSPDGERLATATGNGEVVVWDTTTLEQTVVQPKAEREGMFNVRYLTFSADGETLVYYDTLSEQSHFWDVATQTETAAVDAGSQFFGVSPDGSKLAWATRTDLWYVDLAQPDEIIKVLDFPDNLLVATPTIAFSPDGSRIIVGGFGSAEADNVFYVIGLG